MDGRRDLERRIIERELREAYGRVDDEVAARWLADIPQEKPKHWTPDLVQHRLSDAMATLTRTVARPGPKAVRSVMPEFERSQLSIRDMIEQMNDGSLHLVTNRIARSALARQVTLMEDAINWPGKYLSKWPGPLRVLNTWLFSRAVGVPWSRILRRKGIPRTTAKDARARALKIIAQGLNRDGVPVE